MIDPLHIAESPQCLAAVIHVTIPRDAMQKEMPAAIQEVAATLSQQGTEPTGPLFAHHLALSPEQFDFEVGFPVAKSITPSGRVRMSELPATTVLRSVYRGPYEGLFSAWTEFNDRAKSAEVDLSSYQVGSTIWETYVSGPESDPDPSTWQTEMNVPLTES